MRIATGRRLVGSSGAGLGRVGWEEGGRLLSSVRHGKLRAMHLCQSARVCTIADSEPGKNKNDNDNDKLSVVEMRRDA